MDVDLDSDQSLDISFGGTGAKTAAAARTNLSVSEASHVHTGVYDPAGTAAAVVSDTAYGVSWDTVATIAPSKNAVYDKIETLSPTTHLHTGVYEPVQTAASQAEMVAGTLATIRSMSPLRVAQAIAALSTGGHDAVTLEASLGTNLLNLSTQELSLDTQTANLVFAGPTTGAAAVPSFRAIVPADVPQLFADQAANIVYAGPATGADAAPAFRALVAADIPDISATYQAADADLDVAAGATAAAVSTYFGQNGAGVVGFHALPSGSGLEFDIEAPGAAGGLLQSDGTDYARVDTLTGLTFGGFTVSTAIVSGAAGALESSAVTSTELGYLAGLTGYVKGVTTKTTATTYTIGTTDANEAYGGVIYVTGACTVTAPAVVAGMSFTVITIGDVAVSLDVNASDKMVLDGVTLDDGDKATNTSKAGDIIVCTYYSADGWYCASGSNSGTLWSDGGA